MSKRTIIIAEAGVNHNGSLERALSLVDCAAEAGVDFVKFQTFKADDLVSKEARKADYQINNTKAGDDKQYEMLKSLELSERDHNTLIKHARAMGVAFFSTAFDVKGLEFLYNLGFDLFKVPSGEITNYLYLKKLAAFGKPVILSTGMANMKEIERALEVLTSERLTKKDITVLHCNTEYPTPMEDVNLKAMNTIANELGVKVGYSDHTLGIEVPIAAVALGAQVIEKHFTLDRSLPGPDHSASLEPNELAAMVRSIRNTELALIGDGDKKTSKSERKNLTHGRKSLYYSKDLPINHTLTVSDFICLRPGNGINPMEIPTIIGKKLKKTVHKLEKVSLEDL